MCTILRNWLTSLAFWRNGHRFFHRRDKKGRALVMKFVRINFGPCRIPFSEISLQRATFQSTSFVDRPNYLGDLDYRMNLPSLTIFHACSDLEQESSKKFPLGEKLSISPTKPEKNDFSDVTKHRIPPKHRNSPKMSVSTFIDFYLRRSSSSSIIAKWLYFRSNRQMHQNEKNPEELLREHCQRG